MAELLEQNNITPDRILPLSKITNVIEKTLDDKLSRLEGLEEKLDKLNGSIENVDSPFKEVKDLKKKIEVLDYDNSYLKSQNEKLEQTITDYDRRIQQVVTNNDLIKTREAYRSLLVFAFQNINPVTDFDPAHARNYWENLIN
jgi:prefoldin subunit 5